jgi:hypothetical protein
MMRRGEIGGSGLFRKVLIAVVSLQMAISPIAFADGPSFLRLFGKQKVEANPNNEYTLTEVEGPWLIYARTFSGEDGKQQAHRLVLELRKNYNLKAYVYKEAFDFSQPFADIGPNHRPLKYANSTRYDAYAVLVGEFDSVDHPDVKNTLATLKKIQPTSLDNASLESEAMPISSVKRIQEQLKKNGNRTGRGPMSSAFVTRNPMLPENFTQPPEVDSFVRSLNDKVEHSLLTCPGKFTVVVRTFEGLSATSISGYVKKDFTPSPDRLDLSANTANKMVKALRAKGVEAYEFHDRTKSIVTIGSFDSLGQVGPNGFEYDPAIQRVMTEFRATERVGTDAKTGQLVRYSNAVDKIPFDVEPRPIAVPRATKRSFYSAALGRNE